MGLAWKTLKSGSKIPFMKRNQVANSGGELAVPTHFRCPISLDLMRDPVTAPTGITYDRQSIESWFERGNRTCPVTGQGMKVEELIPNHSIRRMIQEWCVANRGSGVERVPTPRIPMAATEVVEILQQIETASRRGDGARCGKLAAKLKDSAKESERNRRCISSNGASRALSASFGELSSKTGDLEEVLSALVTFLPLDEESHKHIQSPASLKSIVSIIRSGSFQGRFNSTLVLKDLVSSLDSDGIEAVAKTDGLAEVLVQHLQKPISPQLTKTSLVTIFYLVSPNTRAASRFVELGLISLLLDILVDSERSMSEKALGVLDGLFNSERGRQSGGDHALTVPLLVKKMFRVSDMATEFAVSALWKLCKNDDGKESEGEEGIEEERAEEGCLVEALQVGAFQKLLLLLQVGCNGPTKERASDLLKLLNGSRGGVECIETVDFKGLKRPF
ncbi:U-box domain-containing protein 21-like [Typha angustifolia]|uniref:U-box domain-containing protein 21-like n=1 Tax=Typha angustifolia TaxID=59011 RepID=UPI003C2AC16C